MEAEFYLMALAVSNYLWLKNIIAETKLKLHDTIFLEDNQACIQFITKNTWSTKAKHIDIKYHFIRDEFRKSQYKLEYCTTSNMVADGLTKPLKITNLISQCNKINLGNFITGEN